MWASEPRCDGCAKACAMVRSWRSKKAQEKSPRVLILVEYAARRSVAPISSVIASRALRITSKRTGSMSAARVPTDVGAVNREASDVIDRPHGRKEFKVQSSKKVRCVGAALYSET